MEESIPLNGSRVVSRYFSGAVFLLDDMTVLLQKRDDRAPRNPGGISLFGWSAEGSENADECLEREIEEEIGVRIDWCKTRPAIHFIKREMDDTYTLCSIYVNAQIRIQDVGGLLVSEGQPYVCDLKQELPARMTPLCRQIVKTIFPVISEFWS